MCVVVVSLLTWLRYLPEAEELHRRTENVEDDGISNAVERSKALYENRDGVVLRRFHVHQAIDVQEIEYEKRTPTENKCCRKFQQSLIMNRSCYHAQCRNWHNNIRSYEMSSRLFFSATVRWNTQLAFVQEISRYLKDINWKAFKRLVDSHCRYTPWE